VSGLAVGGDRRKEKNILSGVVEKDEGMDCNGKKKA